MALFSGAEVVQISDILISFNAMLPEKYELPSVLRVGEIAIHRKSSEELLGHVVYKEKDNTYRFEPLKGN